MEGPLGDCRLCMASNQGEVDLFTDRDGLESYSEQIRKMFRIEVLITKGSPTAACKDCVRVLDEASELKAKIAASQEIYLMLKDEPPDEIKDEKLSAFVSVQVTDLASIKPGRKETKDEDADDDSNEEAFPEPEITMDTDDDSSSRVAPKSRGGRKKSVKSESDEDSDDNNYGQDEESASEAEPEKPVKQRKKYVGAKACPQSRRNRLKERGPLLVRNQKKLTRAERAELEKMMMNMNLLNCHLCQKPAETFLQLKKHMQAIHKVSGYIFCCDRKQLYDMAHDHMKYHQNNDLYKCDQCGKRLLSGVNLLNHKRTHSQTEIVAFCEICGKGCRSKQTLVVHRMSHVPEADRAFQCDKCERGFTHQSKLNKHILLNHTKTKSHVCHICGKDFYLKSGLKVHFRSHEGPQKAEQCDICQKYYIKLPMHKLRRHQGLGSVKCTVCNKEYKQVDIKRHIATHHSDMDLRCKVCDKTFAQPTGYNNHMKMHQGVRYPCHWCPKESPFRTTINAHMKRVHGEQYWARKRELLSEVYKGVPGVDLRGLHNEMNERIQRKEVEEVEGEPGTSQC